jgi:arylsulfatase A-like enzyme
VPAFATWQGHIKPGSVVQAPLHMVDWYPTLIALAGGSLAQTLPIDGRDAWPAIVEGAPSPHEAILLNATPAMGALRAGDWKLVLNGSDAPGEGDAPAQPRGGARASVELFNLAADPYEKENLAATQPERVKELRARYDAFAREAVPPKARPKPADFQSPRVWGELD